MDVIETLLKDNGDDDTVSLTVDVSISSASNNKQMELESTPQKEGKQPHHQQQQPQKSPNSVTLLEETYRSIDVTKVLRNSPRSSKHWKQKKSSSLSPSNQKRRHEQSVTDNDNHHASTRGRSRERSSSFDSDRMEDKNNHVSNSKNNESDIFLDAFETMEDIAVKLFNPIMMFNDNEEQERDGVGVSISASMSASLDADEDANEDTDNTDTEDNTHKHLKSKQDNNIPETDEGLELENSIDIPFDERGQGLVAVTPVFSNRKGSSSTSPSSVLDHNDDVNGMSAIARIRSKRNSDNGGSGNTRNDRNKDGKSPEEIYRQRQKKWERLKTKAHNDNKNNKNQKNNDSSSTTPVALNLDDCGVFADMTKPLTDAVYQSQAMLYDVLVGDNGIMGNDGITDSQKRRMRRNNSFSSSDSSFGSDDSDDDTDDDDDDDHSESTASNSVTNRRERDLYQKKDISHKREIEEAMDDYDSDDSEDDEQMDSRQVKPSVSLKQFLSDITQHGRKLKWHKPIRSSVHGTKTGIAVNISIVISEPNSGAESVEPNLSWEVILEKKKNKSKVRFQDVKSVRQRLSLFNIASVQKAADSMNLHSFPYAIPEHSILITLHDGTVYFFEAEDEVEAKLVVHGLRWISARLVFNLLAGNRNVCSEMLPLSMNSASCQILSSDVMQAVTDHLVDKSLKRLSERTLSRRLN